MNGLKHIVNRQVVEVAVPERSRSVFIQNKISEVIRRKLNPALDGIFSEISGNGEIVRIDRLIIDLGTVSEYDLDKVFVEKALKEIEETINKVLKSKAEIKLPISDSGGSAALKSMVTIASKPDDALVRFAFFLETGHMPWWHSFSGTNLLSGSDALGEIFAEVLISDAEKLKNILLPVFGKPAVRQRLVFQYSNSQLDALIKKIDNRQFDIFHSQYKILISCFSSKNSSTFKPLISEHFYKTAFRYLHKSLELNSETRKVNFLKEIFDSVSVQFSISGAEIRRQNPTVSEKFKSESFKENISGSDKNWVAVKILVEQFFEKLKENPPAFKETKKAGFSEEMSKSNEKKDIKSSRNKMSPFIPKSSTDEENIFIYNAGLILLHPFLRYFFEGLDLLDHNLDFKSLHHAYKAVHLLQFIVTGNEVAMEPDLVLNKILCGIDVTEPLPKNMQLSEVEKEECVHLIITVLVRWEALKTSNPNALRETFLQREGILKSAGESWNLTIERNTFDIMLEKLPWSVNLVKLPWSNQLIYVEW